MYEHKRGFTIVELLIVVVVIAILAAITIVAYNGIQDRTRQSAAMAAAAQGAQKLALYATDNADTYPANKSAMITAIQLSEGDGRGSLPSYQYSASSDGKTYCLTATTYNLSYYTSSTKQNPQLGACAGHGSNGVAAITNLVSDPRATSYVTTPGAISLGNTRWAGSSPASASYSLVTGASDGPVSNLTTYARKIWSTPPNSIGNSGDTGIEMGRGGTNAYAVNENQVFTMSCYARPSVPRNFELGVYQYTSTGAAFSTSRVRGPTTFGQQNQWTRVSYTYSVPSGVSYILFICDSNSNASNGAANWTTGSMLDVTGLMLTEGTTLYTYADGESSSWAWNGSINNATSSGSPL